MGFSSEVLDLRVDDSIATLWLDRPEALNAMGVAFWNDLPRAAQAIADDTSIRAVIIAARGPHFTVGLDLKQFGGNLFEEDERVASKAVSNARNYATVRRMQKAVTAVAKLEVPVIAAIHGYCIGGGVDLISACDIRLSSSDAIFSIRETKIAIVADIGTLQRLPRIVSAGHVAELAFTGRDFDAQTATSIGLINSTYGVGPDGVLAGATALAQEIAANSPLAVRGTKAVLAANDGRTIDEGLEFVAQWNTMYLQSNDLREAMTAFVEKRPPRFHGN